MSNILKDKRLLGGLALAYPAFALTFQGPRKLFWQRMTRTGLLLGSYALTVEPELRKTRIRPKDLLTGIGSAAGLYVVFQIGDRLARVIVPKGASDIDAIYGLRKLRDKREIAARLALVIGPAEELFWRGLVQKHFEAHLGKVPGAIAGTAAYGGAHLVTGNFTLIGAATVAGAFWGAMSALGASKGALIVSHMVWDVVIFLIAPTVAPED